LRVDERFEQYDGEVKEMNIQTAKVFAEIFVLEKFNEIR